MSQPHEGGPTLRQFEDYSQYKTLKFKGVTLKNNKSDSCIFVTNEADEDNPIILLIKNIVQRQNRIYFLGCRFRNIENLFTIPWASENIGVHCVSDLSDRIEYFPVELFLYKAFILPAEFPENGRFAVYPLYMIDNCVE